MLAEGHLGVPSFANCSWWVEVERKMAMASSQVALYLFVNRVMLLMSLGFGGTVSNTVPREELSC